MALRIQTNLPALFAHRQVNLTQQKLEKSLEKLSSGFRINHAADDAAGLAISERLRTQVHGLNQASRNIQDGISLIQTAEGGLEELHLMMQRMRTLAIQSSNDTNTSADRTLIQKEVTQLIAEVDRMQTTVVFNTKQLLTGDFTSSNPLKLHVGANQAQSLDMTLTSMSTTGLGVNALSIETQANAEAAIATLDTAIDRISSNRADLGAIQNRLEHTFNFVKIAEENMMASESRIRDVDMATEMVNYTKNQILSQAGMAMLSQANLGAQTVLALFG